MSLNRKTKTWTITLVLLFSLLSLNFAQHVSAEEYSDSDLFKEYIDEFVELIDFEDTLSPHPFRHIGVWESNRTMSIDGEMEFDLFFSAPLITQLALLEIINFRDDVNIFVYHADNDGIATLLGNTTKTLEPELLGDNIQESTIKIKDVDTTIQKGERLIFVIEIEQSEKPIDNFAAKRFEEKIIGRFEKAASWLRKTEDPTLNDIAFLIDAILENFTDLGVGGDEFGALTNAIFSSAFYYGSSSHPSSVFFRNDEDENVTIYFHNDYSEYQYEIYYAIGIMPFYKIANETKPTSATENSWPPIWTLFQEAELDEKMENDITTWVALWSLYTLDDGSLIISDKNKVTYYLATDGELTKDKPGDSATIQDPLSKDEALVWTTSGFERNKILDNITAYLNIHYPKLLTLEKVTISVSLKLNDEVIATEEKDIDRTGIIELLQRGPDIPTEFNFADYDGNEEIWNDDDLSIEVTLIKKPLLGSLRPVKINYGSEDYDSRIVLTLKETDNIKLSDLGEKSIYAGGSAHYKLEISSKYDDKIKVNVGTIEKEGSWDAIEVSPKEFNIGKDSSKTVDVIIKSTATDVSANDVDFMEFVVNVSGKTGYVSNTSIVSVSRDAVEYDFEAIAPEEIEIKHGKIGTLTLIIRNKNKGFLSDQYSIDVTSEHDFKLEYTDFTEEITVYDENSENNEEVEVELNITLPWYTTIDSDKLSINITSGESIFYPPEYMETVIVNVSVITPNILESAYRVFESFAENLGITGKYAGWTLIAAAALLLVIILIIVIFIIKRKFVDLICLERIKEINPDETASFDIVVKNPYSSVLNYNIQAVLQNDTKGFDIGIETMQLTLQPNQTKVITLTVKPNDQVKKEDWAEVKVVVKPADKNKSSEIKTITTIKDGRVDVRLSGVFHWPRVFKKGDRVETSFKLWNYGNVSSGKVSIVFYVNGEEKNKVEDITIPRGGHADIEIPWIAEKGKNEVYIVVN